MRLAKRAHSSILLVALTSVTHAATAPQGGPYSAVPAAGPIAKPLISGAQFHPFPAFFFSRGTAKTSGLGPFEINGNSTNYLQQDCDNLQCTALDVVPILGFTQVRYELVKDGSVVATDIQNFYGLHGGYIYEVSFTYPPEPGTYHIERQGIQFDQTPPIEVLENPFLNCNPPVCFEVHSFAGNVQWFYGSDPINKPVVGDFDGDGLDDVAYYGACGTGEACWRVHTSTGSSFSTAGFGAGMWFYGSGPIHAPVAGDFNGDGFDDIAYYGACGSGTPCWRVHLSNGSSFSTTSFGANMWFYGAEPIHAPVAGDFNGDGLDDIAYFGACGTGTPCWRVHLSNGSSFSTKSFGAGMWFYGDGPVHAPIVGDFNNDGLDDITYYGKCGSGRACWRTHLSTGSGFLVTDSGAGIWTGSEPIHAPMAGDFDGDGWKDDIAYYGGCGSGAGVPCWRVHFGDGNGFTRVENYCDGAWFKSSGWTSKPVAGRFTSDAWDDIVYFGACGTGSNCWRGHVLD